MREEYICDERKENLIIKKEKEKKKFSKISKIWVRLFDKCFILKILIKFVEILLKKQFIKTCYKKMLIEYH